ncbi:hypothetical protein G9A89_017952 [Geosiphon pyriformis]|nr:hypothetical protein G9A89_017952 [Geosiphon pyriformis]
MNMSFVLPMSDYWVSQAKHWCRYCRIYIADNKPSRLMHENGKKHRENVERFLRDVHRREEENKKDDDKMKRELERINRAAMKQYKKDVGLATTGSSMTALKTAINTAVASAPPPSTDERDAYYNTPLPLLPDTFSSFTSSSSFQPSTMPNNISVRETTAAVVSTEVIIPMPVTEEEENPNDGSVPVIGKWRPVTPPPPPSPPRKIDENGKLLSGDTADTGFLSDDEEEDDDPDDLRNFKIVEKTLDIVSNGSNEEKVSLKKRKLSTSVVPWDLENMASQTKLPWLVSKKRRTENTEKDKNTNGRLKRPKIVQNATNNLLVAAKSMFSRSAQPARIVGREMERAAIKKFLKSHTLEDQKPGRLYISGSPGTGKTALVHAVCKELELDDSEDLILIELNFNMIFAKNLYLELCKRMAGKVIKRREDAQKEFEALVTDANANEVDNLFEMDPEMLYSLFEYSAFSDGKMVMIAIANEINLEKRLLPRLSAKNISVEALTFRVYQSSEISAIIQDRLKSVGAGETTLMDVQAVELCARKVASEGGDVRQAMEICQLALQSIDEDAKVDKVSVVHISKIANEAFITNQAVQRLRNLTLQQKVLLCCLTLMKKKYSNTNNMTTGKVFQFYQTLCKNNFIDPLTRTEFPDLVAACESNGLLKLSKAKRAEDRKLVTDILANDLREATKDLPLNTIQTDAPSLGKEPWSGSKYKIRKLTDRKIDGIIYIADRLLDFEAIEGARSFLEFQIKNTFSGHLRYNFHQVLKSAKHIVALCGAGLSAESGIPTFRGEGGWWRNFQATELATPSAFRNNPSCVWQFYHYRRELVLTKQPNRAHKALEAFEKKILAEVPRNQTFALITQNVDGLSTGVIQNLIEMHGSLFKTRCTACGDICANRDSPIATSLKGTEDLTFESDIPIEQLPCCTKCKGLLRPHVVWFNENLEESVASRIHEELDRCDLLLVIGTSGLVYPAAGYASYILEKGGKVANFNIEEMGGFNFEFIGPCGEKLPEALQVNIENI